MQKTAIDLDNGRLVRSLRFLRVHAQQSSRAGSEGGARAKGSAGHSPSGAADKLLTDEELSKLELDFPSGLTSVQVVDIFRRRQIRFSEATFRKYVQLGLLARSRRVGRKGKHQGSLGLYPTKTVRRINSIKRLMLQNYTIEDIQRQFLGLGEDIDQLEQGVAKILAGLESAASGLDPKAGAELKRDLETLRKDAADLVHRLEIMESRIAAPNALAATSGAPEGAEDLL